MTLKNSDLFNIDGGVQKSLFDASYVAKPWERFIAHPVLRKCCKDIMIFIAVYICPYYLTQISSHGQFNGESKGAILPRGTNFLAQRILHFQYSLRGEFIL